jgi:hypothetical protein
MEERGTSLQRRLANAVNSRSAKLRVSLNWHAHAKRGNTPIRANGSLSHMLWLTPGGFQGEISEIWHDKAQLKPGIANINLFGILQSISEGTIDFAAIKLLVIINHGATKGAELRADANLEVGGGGIELHAWSAPFKGNADASLTVGCGDILMLSNRLNGLEVDPNRSHILRLENSGSVTIGYEIGLFGIV